MYNIPNNHKMQQITFSNKILSFISFLSGLSTVCIYTFFNCKNSCDGGLIFFQSFAGQRISPPSPWRDYFSPRSSLKRRKKGGRGGIRMKNSYSRCEHTGAASSRVNERWFYFPSPRSGMKGRGKKGGGRETRGGGGC